MRKAQRGVSLTGLLMWGAIIIGVSLLAMKLVPAYLEFATAKKAIYAISTSGAGSVAEVRKSFAARAIIDDISAVGPEDLVVTKEGGQIVISFTYRKEVPLAANVGIYVDFKASSKGLE